MTTDTTTSSSSEGRVFVSSTSYDLIDLRESLEVALRSAGITPVLADRITSGFKNPGDADAIETCLINLRQCEVCIVVLSQRYGEPLQQAHHRGLSATHVEYREAMKQKIPVLFYVRDRLRADHLAWRRDKQQAPQWADARHAEQLFGMIDEQDNPSNPEARNWIWAFRSSVELCDRVLTDLGCTASAAAIRMLTAQGQLPFFGIHTGNLSPSGHMTLTLTNLSTIPALRLNMRDAFGELAHEPQDLGPGQQRNLSVRCPKEALSVRGGHAPVVRVDYETPTGHRISDLLAAVFGGGTGYCFVPAGRHFVGRSLRTTSPQIVTHDGFCLIPIEPINAAHEAGTL